MNFPAFRLPKANHMDMLGLSAFVSSLNSRICVNVSAFGREKRLLRETSFY